MADYRYTIGQLKHRVRICSLKDVVDSNGTMQLARNDVYSCWANIYAVRGAMFSKAGYTIKENLDYRTHICRVRYQQSIDITSAAWVYEERRKSPPRWFKVLNISDLDEDSRWYEFEVRLVETSIEAVAPVAKPSDLLAPQPRPEWVKL